MDEEERNQREQKKKQIMTAKKLAESLGISNQDLENAAKSVGIENPFSTTYSAPKKKKPGLKEMKDYTDESMKQLEKRTKKYSFGLVGGVAGTVAKFPGFVFEQMKKFGKFIMNGFFDLIGGEKTKNLVDELFNFIKLSLVTGGVFMFLKKLPEIIKWMTDDMPKMFMNFLDTFKHLTIGLFTMVKDSFTDVLTDMMFYVLHGTVSGVVKFVLFNEKAAMKTANWVTGIVMDRSMTEDGDIAHGMDGNVTIKRASAWKKAEDNDRGNPDGFFNSLEKLKKSIRNPFTKDGLYKRGTIQLSNDEIRSIIDDQMAEFKKNNPDVDSKFIPSEELIHQQILQESSGFVDTISSTGVIGLTQFTDKTARGMSESGIVGAGFNLHGTKRHPDDNRPIHNVKKEGGKIISFDEGPDPKDERLNPNKAIYNQIALMYKNMEAFGGDEKSAVEAYNASEDVVKMRNKGMSQQEIQKKHKFYTEDKEKEVDNYYEKIKKQDITTSTTPTTEKNDLPKKIESTSNDIINTPVIIEQPPIIEEQNIDDDIEDISYETGYKMGESFASFMNDNKNNNKFANTIFTPNLTLRNEESAAKAQNDVRIT